MRAWLVAAWPAARSLACRRRLTSSAAYLQLAQRKAAGPRFAAAALSDEPTITPISSTDGEVVEVTQRLNAEELAALGTFSAAEELPPKAQNWPWLTAPCVPAPG